MQKYIQEDQNNAKRKSTFKHMQSFVKKEGKQKGTISYVTNLFSTTEQRQELERQFIQLDENKDGKISFEEMKKGYKTVFPQEIGEKEIQQIFNAIDTDKSGFIDFSEFISATIDAKQYMTVEKLEQLFQSIDKDGSGTISIVELKQILQSVKRGSENFINQLIDEMTEDNQCEINYREFLNIIINQHQDTSQNAGMIQKIIKNSIRRCSIKHLVARKLSSPFKKEIMSPRSSQIYIRTQSEEANIESPLSHKEGLLKKCQTLKRIQEEQYKQSD